MIAREGAQLTELRKAVAAVTRKPPLSKFGLDVVVKVVGARAWKSSRFVADLAKEQLYIYTKGAFHSHEGAFPVTRLQAVLKEACEGNRHRVPPIVSPIGIDIPLMVIG